MHRTLTIFHGERRKIELHNAPVPLLSSTKGNQMRNCHPLLGSTAIICLLLVAGCGRSANDESSDARPGERKTAVHFLQKAQSDSKSCPAWDDPQLGSGTCDEIINDFNRAFAKQKEDPSESFSENWKEITSDLKPFFSKRAIACASVTDENDKEEVKRCNVAYSIVDYITKTDKEFDNLHPSDQNSSVNWKNRAREWAKKGIDVGKTIADNLKKAAKEGRKLPKPRIMVL